MGLVEQIHDICAGRDFKNLTISANGTGLVIDLNRGYAENLWDNQQAFLSWKELMLYPGDAEEMIERTLRMLEYTSMKGQ